MTVSRLYGLSPRLCLYPNIIMLLIITVLAIQKAMLTIKFEKLILTINNNNLKMKLRHYFPTPKTFFTSFNECNQTWEFS